MCLVLIAKNRHPNYKYIILGNRDEFYNRETETTDYRNNKIICGIDKKAGGTWIGINKSGKFSTVTNYRDGKLEKDHKQSRGILLRNYLLNKLEINKEDLSRYNPLNVIYGDFDNLFYRSNVTMEHKALKSGIYGLSNHLLDSNWPKVQLCKSLFTKIITAQKLNTEQLFQTMRLEKMFPDNILPRTNIPLEWERKLSSPFINSENYGTRSTTLILIDKLKKVEFFEKSFDNNAKVFSEKHFRMEIL